MAYLRQWRTTGSSQAPAGIVRVAGRRATFTFNLRSIGMQITDLLAQVGGIESMARELGVPQSEVASGAEALLPAILGGFKRQAQAQPAGLDGLGGLLGQLGGGGLLDQVLAPEPTDVRQGNDVLGQIFGSRDVSRTVTQNAAAQSGLDPSLLKKLLPLLAMLVTGFLARQQGASPMAPTSMPSMPSTPSMPPDGGLGDLMGSLLAGGGAPAGRAMPGNAAPGLGSLLDLNGDGNPLDDILRMAGRAMR
jgi:hypothetical protein